MSGCTARSADTEGTAEAHKTGKARASVNFTVHIRKHARRMDGPRYMAQQNR